MENVGTLARKVTKEKESLKSLEEHENDNADSMEEELGAQAAVDAEHDRVAKNKQ